MRIDDATQNGGYNLRMEMPAIVSRPGQALTATRRQIALFGSAAAAAILVGLSAYGASVHPTNAVIILLLLTLVVTDTFGLRAGIVLAFLADAVLAYFFFAPIYNFAVASAEYQMALAVFVLVSIVAGSLLKGGTAGAGVSAGQGDVETNPPSTRTPWPEPAPAPSDSEADCEESAAWDSNVIALDLQRHIVVVSGRDVSLTPTEFSLLTFFATNPGRTLQRQAILRSVWGEGYEQDSQILRTYIKQLRSKLGDSSETPRFIRTEPGFGYRFIGEMRDDYPR